MTDAQMWGIMQILNTYDRDNQLLKAIEELQELIDEIRKERTAETLDNYEYDVKNSIMTEIADVIIMCEQLRVMHSITVEELDKEINYKINRQLDRIKNDEDELKQIVMRYFGK